MNYIIAYSSSLKICLFLLVFFNLLHSIELNTTELQNDNDYSYKKLVAKNIDNEVSGILKICLSSEPDGTALVEDTSTRDEILIVFKVEHFWLLNTNQLYEYLNRTSEPTKTLINSENQIKTSNIWPEFPSSPQSAVSFSGHNNKSKFYNQVLVFKDSFLFRYQVKELYAKRNSLIVNLISIHSTSYWSTFPNIRDVQYLTIPRNTRILVAPKVSWSANYLNADNTAYMLNTNNLDNPIEYYIYNFGLPGGFKDYNSLRFHHMLSNGKTIIFLTTGELCMGQKCEKLQKLATCESSWDAFANSFPYWLWRNSDFTIRLLIIGLSSIMVVNLVLATFYIINQVKRINDLT